MYIGSTDARGLHHLVSEVVDNSIDEVLAGACDEIRVTLHADGSCSVWDNGRGIPVEEHPKYHRPALEIVMTVLHAGSKFDKNTYKVSGGLHGVGVHVVNALSEWFEVRVRRDGHEYFQRYEHGAPVMPLEMVGPADSTGTQARFKPDGTVLETTNFDRDTIARRLKELSFLNAGVTIHFSDERDGSHQAFHHAGGIAEFVEDVNQASTPLFKPPIYLHAKRDTTDIELALQYNDGYNETTLAFVNNINTMDGGTHVVGLRAALDPDAQRLCPSEGLHQGRQGGADGGGRPRRAHGGALRQGPGTSVRGSNEGPPRQLRGKGSGGERGQREALRVPRGTSLGGAGAHLEGGPGRAGARGRPQGPRTDPTERPSRGWRTPREARRLPLAGPGRV